MLLALSILEAGNKDFDSHLIPNFMRVPFNTFPFQFLICHDTGYFHWLMQSLLGFC